MDATEALKVEKAAHQTQLTLNAIATSGKEAGLSEENAKELAIQSMAVKLEKASSDGGKINLNNEDVLKDLVSIAETKITEKGIDVKNVSIGEPLVSCILRILKELPKFDLEIIFSWIKLRCI